jgi:predicted RNA-binding protein (virulence factor B family)
MPELGKTNQLTIIKIVGDVLTLDAKEFGNIDIMNDDLVFKYNVGQVIEVFLYLDSEGTVAASFDKGFANVAEFARLKVVAVTKFGAFMDWGIAKDLLCPFKEQKADLVIGSFYNVYIYVDDLTKRIVATTKFEKFICTDKPENNRRSTS